MYADGEGRAVRSPLPSSFFERRARGFLAMNDFSSGNARVRWQERPGGGFSPGEGSALTKG